MCPSSFKKASSIVFRQDELRRFFSNRKFLKSCFSLNTFLKMFSERIPCSLQSYKANLGFETSFATGSFNYTFY